MSFARSLLLPAVIVLPLACRGNTRPPPPCVPSSLTEERAVSTLKAWDGWKPLLGWKTRSARLDGCLDEAGKDTLDVSLSAPPCGPKPQLEYRASMRFKVNATEGSPARPAALAAEVQRLAAALPAAAKAASPDPVVAAWCAAHRPKSATYQADAKPPGHCLTYSAASGAPPPQLTWCEPGGVTKVTLSGATELPFEPARALRAALRAALPSAEIVEAELQRWRHAKTMAWRASGTLGPPAAPRTFEAKQAPDASWKLTLGPAR